MYITNWQLFGKKNPLIAGMWVGIEKKKRKCCSLSWQRIVGQLDCDNSTVDKLYRLYADCKDNYI